VATGERFALALPDNAYRWSGTGPYLAQFDPGGTYAARADIVVFDARTGQEVYRVPDQTAYYALGEDGLLALFDPASGELSWADANEPFPHAIGMVAPTYNLELSARRRVIALVTAISTNTPRRLSLFDLAGRQASQVDTEAAAEWGFDGRRLAWVSKPCGLAAIRVWDHGDNPPDLADKRCPAGSLLDASSRVGRRGRIFVKAGCPARPALGCTGAMRLVAKAGRRSRRHVLGELPYAASSADTERLKLKLTRKNRRFIRRHGSVKVIAVSRAVQREGFDTIERRRFRFQLKWRRR
jgi:hypothetical protein